MAYRVSTNRTGDRRWWQAHHAIPAEHTDIRPATESEAAVMDKIAHAKGTPSLALAERLRAMLA